MANTSTLTSIIHAMALDAFDARQPANVTIGEIVSTDPLRIKVRDGFVISQADFLTVCSHLADTNPQAGDRVVLIKAQGGSAYYAIDTVWEV